MRRAPRRSRILNGLTSNTNLNYSDHRLYAVDSQREKSALPSHVGFLTAAAGILLLVFTGQLPTDMAALSLAGIIGAGIFLMVRDRTR